MFFFETLLLALALCVDSFTVSTACAFRNRMSIRSGITMAVVFAVFQGGFPFLGALLGVAFRAFVSSIDHWVAFALLLFVGCKMIVDALRNTSDDCQIKDLNFGIMCLLGIATSIDAFAVGVTLGLENSIPQVLFITLIIAAVTFLVSILGVVLGRHKIPIPERTASIVAGMVLIVLGIISLVCN